jgi:NAD(P)H-hydrate epimerase
MATAGSGDVLTGIITSLLAQKYEALTAARLGVYLHGLAGDLGVHNMGEEGLTATGIIQYLPEAFAYLRKREIPKASEGENQ